MNKLNISDTFEDISIVGRNIAVEIIKEVDKEIFLKNTSYTGIWQDMVSIPNPEAKSLIGKVLIIFRNQRDNSNLAIFLSGDFILKSGLTNTYAELFNKFIQYSFDWVKNYVEENDINDSNGNEFIMPAYLYSTGYFEYSFPE